MISIAVIYECVQTITTIYPSYPLIDAASSAISRFVTSNNSNLKYLGIQALKSLVKIDTKYATQHQSIVIEALEDEDEAMKRIVSFLSIVF